jgi:hypothetical protein
LLLAESNIKELELRGEEYVQLLPGENQLEKK